MSPSGKAQRSSRPVNDVQLFGATKPYGNGVRAMYRRENSGGARLLACSAIAAGHLIARPAELQR
jgi:hypothetical protein